jgi:hypothetical protein
MGKVLGGGMNLGLVAGRKEIMDLASPTAGHAKGKGVLIGGGTFSCMIPSMIAGRAMLRYLEEHEKERTRRYGPADFSQAIPYLPVYSMNYYDAQQLQLQGALNEVASGIDNTWTRMAFAWEWADGLCDDPACSVLKYSIQRRSRCS